MSKSNRIEIPGYDFTDCYVSKADKYKLERIASLYGVFDPGSHFQHACGIYSKNWISGGSNERRDHAKLYPYREALHAEQVALMTATGSVKGSTLYVSRASTFDGSIKMSKPCFWCMHNIIAADISKVVYSHDETTVRAFKVSTVEIVSYKDIEIGSSYEVLS